jgi:hypothetical protein
MNELIPQQIHDEIMHFIHMEGSPYSNWYVGITSNPHVRLFSDHNVEVRNSWWVIKKAKSSDGAKSVKRTLIGTYGIDGGSDGGDENSIYVYAYRKTETTKP